MQADEISLENIINEIRPIDRQWIDQAKKRTSQLVMPTRALGELHNIAERMCAIQKSMTPRAGKKAVLVFAGDHGIMQEGVSPYPQEITGEMVRTFLKGGAGINAICRHVGADVTVVDMGIIPDFDPAKIEGGEKLRVHKLGQGTANFAQGPAMSRKEAEEAVLFGFELAADLFEQGVQILGTGDMGLGNTSPSAAIGTLCTGRSLEIMVGRGTGVDDNGLEKKRSVIQKGIALNSPDPRDGLDVLAKVGGFEIGGIAGCMLAGAYYSRPVMVDGFISSAGALIAHSLCPQVIDYLFAGHCSEEQGHQAMLSFLELKPLLDLNMRLGEGTGGALAMSVIDAALRVFREVLTFEEAGVTDKE